MNWPKHFQEDCPPPEDSQPARTYYFLVSRAEDPPSEDFLPLAERADYKPKGSKSSRCRHCALSVFVSQEAIRNFLVNRGESLYSRVIAEMGVTAPFGKIIRDNRPEGHCNWWLFEGQSFRQFFVRGL